ncbi:hypothetical protein AKJ52_01915 [candidate division MSBL1 archaeon SCGC-AAA382C18]|uniref:Uncharacterized protein n=1 Tax=candidate division MSBL1 archaeon SCGC-AAA382C18 TaxID=1698281 RepID=A0A133VJJ6_9EURY|nr:hypothetical protein AKJ52_01915 [candidate division MSBL1 archaeon SCGC-AAA382C18]
MKRLGFPDEEIYDALTGSGLPGGDVQLLMDRIEADFEDAEMDSQKYRLAEEVEQIIEQKIEKMETNIESKYRSADRNIKEVQNELSSLKNRMMEFQKILSKIKTEK